MRQRTTFFHQNEDGIEPTSLKVAGPSISAPDVLAVREDRITLGLDELPSEIHELLRNTQELHIRWVSPYPYDPIGPWNSRLPPGLHVFYTPAQGQDKDQDDQNQNPESDELLCPLIKTVFGVEDCSSLSESFTKLPNDRFSHSTAYQYYQPLSSLEHLASYAEQYACASSDAECTQQMQRISGAATLDISWDVIAHIARMTAMWPRERQPVSVRARPGHRVEVGILTPDESPHIEAHELGVTGLLTVLGEEEAAGGDAKPSPVLFSFPSRHMDARASFSSSFASPAGLHPALRLRLPAAAAARPPMDEDLAHCALHAYLALPRAVFADRYQLDDALFLASKNLTALRWASRPVDLEAPDYVMKTWGSSVLLELRTPPEGNSDGGGGGAGEDWTAEIPLHLRYLAPAPGGYRELEVPAPTVFWACTAEEGTKFANSPFERAHLGYDGLFGPRTMFWHLRPEPGDAGSRLLLNTVRVPVLDLDRSAWVRPGTAAVVLLGFAWVAWRLLVVYLRSGHGSGSGSGSGSGQRSEAAEKKEQ